MTEDYVQGALFNRVMNRLQGKEFEPEQKEGKLSDQQLKLQEDLARIENFKAEMQGIAFSIQALVNLFNAKIDEGLSGVDSIIKQEPEPFREIFKVNFDKFENLMQNEVEMRK